MTPEKFLRTLKDPQQEQAKDNVREMLDSKDTYITNISEESYSPGESTIIIRIRRRVEITPGTMVFEEWDYDQ